MAGTICGTAGAYLSEMRELLARLEAARIDALAETVYEAWRDDRTVFVFGNGGSASTASHWVADLVKTAAVDGRRRLRAMSLVDNVGLTTAIGNDLDYERTLVYPLESYARRGDVAVAISASGNSPNVVAACQWAREHGVRVVAVTGFAGGRIAELCDLHVNVPSENYGLIEDLHLSLGHMVAQGLKTRVTNGRTA